MTSQIEHPIVANTAEAIRADYCAEAGAGDVMCGAQGDNIQIWQSILEEVLTSGSGSIADAQERVRRHVQEIERFTG